MRVLIATDAIGGLSSAEAGEALGRAFQDARPGVQVAVVPVGTGGTSLARALAGLGDTSVVVVDQDAHHTAAFDLDASSVELGNRLREALASSPRRVVVDLTQVASLDGGAGLLSALGAVADVPLDRGLAGLTGLSTLDVTRVREHVQATELIGVVRPDEVTLPLLGLRGVVVRRGHANDVPPTDLLPADASLGALAHALGIAESPGLGAAGGLALAIRALGGSITSGPALCAQRAGLERTAARADVVVSGCDQLDFAERGGPVVTEMAALAERNLRPCIVVARDVQVSARELRTFGVEAAYSIGGGIDIEADELARRAVGVASSWTW